MKKFVQWFNSLVHQIGVLLFTPPAPPVSPHCTNINMLLMHLCDFDHARYCYILRWLAYPLRNPGARMCYGIIFTGHPGTGMSMFFENVAIALHHGNGRVVDGYALESAFNDGWAGAPLVVINDHIIRHTLERIKRVMTSDGLAVHAKHQPARAIPNQMNFVLTSNATDTMRRAGADRRFLVMEAPPPRERVFYMAVAAEIKDGGVDAFREFLLHGLDMDGFNESTMPPAPGKPVARPASEHRGGSAQAAREAA